MLKKVRVDNKDIPVPVPIQNMNDALSWIEETLVPEHSILTKVYLNGTDMLDACVKELSQTSLDESSMLEVQIESPWDLSIKTLDVIRDLANAIEKRLKAIAVECWEYTSEVSLKQVKDTADDLTLILELINHINGIMDYSQREMAPVNGLARLIARPLKELEKSIKQSEWKHCSHLLLNRIEPLLKEMVLESENLQISILSANREPLLSPQLEIG
ncbi:MAG: hypothetical protein HRU09_01505 [Oligoflexales bacterium]|nr:hypothetical protein [Oligoflexales bacterium]